MAKPKEMQLSMQSSYADDRWHITLQAWIGTKAAASTLIKVLELAREVLPDELPPEKEEG